MHRYVEVESLELETVEDVAVPNVPLPAAAGQRRSAVNKALLVYTKHAHLGHCTDESSIPSALAKREGCEWHHRKGMLGNALVRGKGKGSLSTLGLGKVLVVPGANGAVKLLGRVWCSDALLGGGVSTK